MRLHAYPQIRCFPLFPSLMRILPSVTRALALHLCLAQGFPVAFAVSGQTIDTTQYLEQGTQEDNVDATTTTEAEQKAGSDVEEYLNITGESTVDIDVDQTFDGHQDVDIHQTECMGGSGNQLCMQDASPTITTEVTQTIQGHAGNDITTNQEAGTGSTQLLDVDLDATVDITATQTVTTETIIDIFQECDIYKGVCVQRALPEVLTLASQLIAASALNTLTSTQEAGTGSVQDVNADLVADVNVSAQQYISPRTFLNLTQICTMDIGMCIQRALPVVRTVVQQVIDAQAWNETDIVQTGGDAQGVALDTDTDTDVTATIEVDEQNTFALLQDCQIKQGLCLHVDENGAPRYVFSDGETVTRGAYVGNLDETPMQAEYSRATVGKAASGICGGAATCVMVQQLLLWLFGPETVEPTATASAGGSDEEGSSNASHRGNDTNILGATMDFLIAQADEFSAVPDAAFGGKIMQPAEEHYDIFCSMRKKLMKKEYGEGVWAWTAAQLANETGVNKEDILIFLRDPAVCPQPVVEKEETTVINFFPVAEDGPISGNALWNDCIRGNMVTLEDIKANSDRNEDNIPRTCASYHTNDFWTHPDLGIQFRWSRFTKELILPEGYVPSKRSAASLMVQP